MAYDPTMDYVHEYLEFLIERSGKTQSQIAEEVGYDRPNFITMLKQGRSKIPLDKVPALAKALKTDPAFLLWMCMRDYHPTLMQVINDTMGRMVTANEFRVIDALRDVWGDSVPYYDEAELELLRDLFGPNKDEED